MKEITLYAIVKLTVAVPEDCPVSAAFTADLIDEIGNEVDYSFAYTSDDLSTTIKATELMEVTESKPIGS